MDYKRTNVFAMYPVLFLVVDIVIALITYSELKKTKTHSTNTHF